MMPSINIFLQMPGQSKKEKKKNSIQEALERRRHEESSKKMEDMLKQMEKIAAKTGQTSHVGGG